MCGEEETRQLKVAENWQAAPSGAAVGSSATASPLWQLWVENLVLVAWRRRGGNARQWWLVCVFSLSRQKKMKQ